MFRKQEQKQGFISNQIPKHIPKHMMKRALAGTLLVSLLALSGCGNSDMDPLVPARDITYTRLQQNTVFVQKGDLTPTYTQEINLSGYNEVILRIEKSKMEAIEMEYKVKFKSLNVDVGDKVSVGDTILSFDSESLTKQIRQSTVGRTKSVLEKEHYQKLMDIDPSLDYFDEMVSLGNDISLADTYIQDINDTYDKINVISEVEGVVSYVDPSVKDGFIVVGSPIVKIVNDDGYYIMDRTKNSTGSATEDFEFHVGDVFTAKTMVSEYQVEVIEGPGGAGSDTASAGDASAQDDTDAEDTSEESAGSTGKGKLITSDKVYFKLVNNEVLKEKSLVLYKELPEIKDAIYVDKRAVIQHEDQYFVHLQQEDGLFKAIEVELGDTVGQYTVITKGLEEGDVVSISEE